MSGKGDAPRPKSVSAETFAERWEKALGPAGSTQYDVYYKGEHIAHVRRPPEKEKP